MVAPVVTTASTSLVAPPIIELPGVLAQVSGFSLGSISRYTHAIAQAGRAFWLAGTKGYRFGVDVQTGEQHGMSRFGTAAKVYRLHLARTPQELALSGQRVQNHGVAGIAVETLFHGLGNVHVPQELDELVPSFYGHETIAANLGTAGAMKLEQLLSLEGISSAQRLFASRALMQFYAKQTRVFILAGKFEEAMEVLFKGIDCLFEAYGAVTDTSVGDYLMDYVCRGTPKPASKVTVEASFRAYIDFAVDTLGQVPRTGYLLAEHRRLERDGRFDVKEAILTSAIIRRQDEASRAFVGQNYLPEQGASCSLTNCLCLRYMVSQPVLWRLQLEAVARQQRSLHLPSGFSMQFIAAIGLLKEHPTNEFALRIVMGEFCRRTDVESFEDLAEFVSDRPFIREFSRARVGLREPLNQLADPSNIETDPIGTFAAAATLLTLFRNHKAQEVANRSLFLIFEELDAAREYETALMLLDYLDRMALCNCSTLLLQLYKRFSVIDNPISQRAETLLAHYRIARPCQRQVSIARF